MIKDFLISFRDNFKEKTRNPFLGTYLIVWIIRNWELIYTIFNFDKNYQLKDKVDFIKTYYSEQSFIGNLLTTALWAFGLLILTYLLLAISRLITNFSEKQITPWIYKITDSKSIVLKETFENLRIENTRIETKLEIERENKKRLLLEISELENTIDKINSNNNEEGNHNEETKKNISLDNEVDVLFNKIKKKNLIDEFIELVESIGKEEQGWIKTEDLTDSFGYFVKLGLLASGKDNVNYLELALTNVGEKVLRRSRLEIE
ncbi:hypothetical protein ACFQ3R_11380 [Mesonia ostreae]|uniref:Uncharacterized protein n=1 Tax=Mesonia ostreae TaxID=861110 RepID=A0ABU2KMJ7_9FLAO|nr:hypothetical protein [Mesonia ostreae]MDT0295930.1 hypothetical protein [Mesonia ostreae]